MITYRYLALALCLAFAVGSMPVFGHEEHCHKKDAAGKLTDWPDAKDKKSCEEKGGVWTHHHAHCHKSDASGKHVDLKDAKDEKACLASGGKWSDHGHEKLAE